MSRSESKESRSVSNRSQRSPYLNNYGHDGPDLTPKCADLIAYSSECPYLSYMSSDYAHYDPECPDINPKCPDLDDYGPDSQDLTHWTP